MIKALLVLSVMFIVGGCKKYNNPNPKESRNENQVVKICIDGVSYVLWSHGISVMLDKDSKIIPCQ